jgi:hypothetical protein
MGAALALVLATGAASHSLGAAGPACQLTGIDRVVAVGDVHGAYDRFVEILQASQLVDDRLRWTGGKTHLVQLGDVVDRGPDSLKALELLERLQKDASRAGGAVHALLGNHEVMRMLGDLRYTTPGEYAAFTSGKSQETRNQYLEQAKAANEPAATMPPLGFVELRLAFGQEGRWGKWLRTLDPVLEINGIVFVHGGISPAIAGLTCDAINETVHRELTTDLAKTRSNPLATLSAGVDGPLWYRGLAQEPDAFAPMVDDMLAKQKARAIVVGHTVSPTGRVLPRFGGKVFQIDTGMQPAYVPNGRASALEIDHGTITAIYTDRRDVLSNERGEPAAAGAPAR